MTPMSTLFIYWKGAERDKRVWHLDGNRVKVLDLLKTEAESGEIGQGFEENKWPRWIGIWALKLLTVNLGSREWFPCCNKPSRLCGKTQFIVVICFPVAWSHPWVWRICTCLKLSGGVEYFTWVILWEGWDPANGVIKIPWRSSLFVYVLFSLPHTYVCWSLRSIILFWENFLCSLLPLCYLVWGSWWAQCIYKVLCHHFVSSLYQATMESTEHRPRDSQSHTT